MATHHPSSRCESPLCPTEKCAEKCAYPLLPSYLRNRSIGDQIRYIAGEVMKHADLILELRGVALSLEMVADDTDRAGS